MSIDFPANLEPDAISFGLEQNVTVFQSDLNNATQHRAMPGDRWAGTMTFTNRDAATGGRELKAFLMRLGGPVGRFRMVPHEIDNKGTYGGAGTVAGAGQTGTTLNTEGWAANQPLVAAAGDYIEVNGELKMIVEDAGSNASGQAVLAFAPALRRSPPNASPIEHERPTAEYFLTNDQQVRWRVSAPIIHAISIAFAEDVT